ncbi:hypothetical protein GB864_17980, partial [Agromyces sp. MMS17-SY077]|nr:hypothetical protein [Agromyces seonyuensis]
MPGTIVVAGAGAGPAAEEFARAGGWPLIAEVVSGAHFGPNLVVAGRTLLHDPDFGGRVRRVIVFGYPTLSREIPAIIGQPEVEAIVVAPAGAEWYNPGRRVRRFERGVVALPHAASEADRAWLGRWVSASRHVLDFDERQDADRAAAAAAPARGSAERAAGSAETVIDPAEAAESPVESEPAAKPQAPVTAPVAVPVGAPETESAADDPLAAPDDAPWMPRKLPPEPAAFDDYAARREYAEQSLAEFRAPITRRSLALAVWKSTWPHDRLVLAASRLVRELDAAAPGKRIEVRANRGLAGIDGTVSTAVGVAVAARAGALAAAADADPGDPRAQAA